MMGIVNTVRTLSQGIGPILTGHFAEGGRIWIAFVLAGSLKVVYDGLLWIFFGKYKTREERVVGSVSAEEEVG